MKLFSSNNRGQIQCLFDQPVQRKYYEQLFEDDAPGRKYDVSQQCKFVFGPQSELCPYMVCIVCLQRKWCTVTKNWINLIDNDGFQRRVLIFLATIPLLIFFTFSRKRQD